MEVVKAHADAESALQNLEASQTLLTAAQNALASSQRKFERGAADILEMLSTQSALADAQQERIRCLAEWHSSRLRLLATAGTLGRSAIRE
jgi:outer membrane protein